MAFTRTSVPAYWKELVWQRLMTLQTKRKTKTKPSASQGDKTCKGLTQPWRPSILANQRQNGDQPLINCRASSQSPHLSCLPTEPTRGSADNRTTRLLLAALAGDLHRLTGVLAGQKGTQGIDAHHAHKRFLVLGLQIGSRCNAGVGEKDIETTIGLHGLVNDASDTLCRSGIDSAGDALDAGVLLLDIGGELLETVQRQVGRIDHLGCASRQGIDRRTAMEVSVKGTGLPSGHTQCRILSQHR